MSSTIYALYYVDPAAPDVRRYFYVGRSINMPRREKEHRYTEAKGHEDKYEFMRALDQRGLTWHGEVLKKIPDGEYPPDNERWYVILLTRQGHTLMNMRHGSVERRREMAEQVKNASIRSVADVARYRSIRKYAASRHLRRRQLEVALKSEGIPNVAADQLLPPILRKRLLAKDCQRVEKGVTLAEIIQLERAEPKLRRILAKAKLRGEA